MKKWSETPTAIEWDALRAAFENALTENNTGFFENIYIPVKIPTADGMPEEYTYQNVGLTNEEIAEIYANFYGQNYIVEPLRKCNGEPWDYVYSYGKLGHRISAVLKMNRAKYLKLIELGGYSYNPLWNIDGEEIYSSLENSGVTDEHTESGEDRTQWTDTKLTQQTNTNTYEAGSAKPAQTVTTTGDPETDSSGTPTKNYTRTRADPEYNATDRTYTHHNADNGGAEYRVSAADTAFNQAATGGDRYHTDKRIRRGNIGVTATQDLIKKQKAAIRSGVLQEFFDDINEQILIGIYVF